MYRNLDTSAWEVSVVVVVVVVVVQSDTRIEMQRKVLVNLPNIKLQTRKKRLISS
jgi:hypothetical protein